MQPATMIALFLLVTGCGTSGGSSATIETRTYELTETPTSMGEKANAHDLEDGRRWLSARFEAKDLQHHQLYLLIPAGKRLISCHADLIAHHELADAYRQVCQSLVVTTLVEARPLQ